jgi:hypothetical protein
MFVAKVMVRSALKTRDTLKIFLPMIQSLPIVDAALFFEVSGTSKKSTSTQILNETHFEVEEINFMSHYPAGRHVDPAVDV